MTEKLDDFRKQLEDLDAKLSDPDVMKDMSQYKNLMLERSHLVPIVEELENLKSLMENLADNEAREELEEIMNLSDRIAVIFKGQTQAVLERGQATTERLGMLMAGVREDE